MKYLKTWAALTGAIALAALSGCGGGVVEEAGPDFDVGVQVNSHPLAGVDIFPGDVQTVYLPVGSTLELDASGPVDWSVVAGGTPVASAGTTFYVAGVTLQEVLTNSAQFVVSTTAAAPLPASVPITLYATSQWDGQQVATIQLVVTN